MQQPAAPTKVMPENWRTGLAVVAHPDDLEYGAAAAIAKWTAQGKKISYVMVSKGEAGIDGMEPLEVGRLRSQEEINAARVVGVETVEFLDHADGVIEYGPKLRRDLSRAIRRHRPDVVITINHHLQFFSGHLNMADHRWVGLAVFDAARDAGNRWIFPELLDEGIGNLERSAFRGSVRLHDTDSRCGCFGTLGNRVGFAARAQSLSGEFGRRGQQPV